MAKKAPAREQPAPDQAAPVPETETETEPLLPVVLRLENTFEYHLQLSRRQIEAILDPSVPDQFIEVPLPAAMRNQSQSGTRRFLQTSWVKEIDVKGL